MLALITFYWLWLLLAFIIGLVTAWWAWGPRPVAMTFPVPSDDEMDAPHEKIVWGNQPDVETFTPLAADPADYPARRSTDAAKPLPTLAEANEYLLSDPVAPAIAPAPPAPARPVASPLSANDLTIIKGIGPQLNTLLGSLGVTRFDQIAAWGPAEIERIDSHLGVFRGRIIRDEWVQQARLLAGGDIAGFKQRYGEQ